MNDLSRTAPETMSDGATAAPPIEVAKFRTLMRNVGSSVAVITASLQGTDHGMTATAVCSVSADPAQILIVINRSNRTHAIVAAARRFTVNFLADHQAKYGQRFAEKHPSPFDGVRCTKGRHGMIIDGCAAFLECHTMTELEVGTHTIFVARVVGGEAICAAPLLYHAGQYKSLVERTPEYEISSIFSSRWSPRAFEEIEISDGELMSFLEAARWAPSAMNEQPWRFVVVKRSCAAWSKATSVLSRTNRSWADKASALVVIVSKSTAEYGGTSYPSTTHQFDAGAAWMSFALQAHMAGWRTHAMAGFDRQLADAVFRIPLDHCINAIVAVGKRGDPEALPESLRTREAPNDRRPLEELVFNETFETPYRDAR
jgi:flavin reductase (DIM6/NTAB) family NADH-FMN oxidoreductase RutF/nitroreductase